MNLLFSFLLGFPYKEELSDLSESKDDLNEISDEKGKKNKIKSDDKIKMLRLDENIVIPIMSLRQSFKLQYSLPSNEDKKKAIQIIYYGTCAEITFQNVTTVIKCIIIEDISFLYFTVLHYINTKDLNSLVQIKNQNIQFDFRENTNGVKANKLVDKMFYYFTEDNQTDFGYLLETKDGEIPNKIEQLTQKCGKNDYLFIRPCKFHWKNLSILLKRALNEIKTRKILQALKRCQALREANSDKTFTKETATSRETKTDRSAKSRKSDKLNPPDMLISVSGQKILYEKSVWITESFNETLNQGLIYTGLIMTNTGIYTQQQRSFLKSLSFYIRSIQNVPPCIKEKHNVNKIHIEYSFEPVFKYEKSDPIEIQDSDKLKIKDIKIFFNNEISDDRLIEAIQNNLAVFKIYGWREKRDKVITPKVWGQGLSCTDFVKRFNQFIDPFEIDKENDNMKKEDVKVESRKTKTGSKKSKKSPSLTSQQLLEMNEESVVLGYASISLYDLMKYTFRMTTSAPLQSTFLPPSNEIQVPLRPFNVMHFHKDYRPLQKGIVDAKEYNDHKTFLKVEVKIGYDLARNVLHNVLTYPTLFAVCIIIDYDTKASYTLLKEILQHNKTTINEGKDMPNVLYQNLGISPEIPLGRKISQDGINKPYVESFGMKDTQSKDQNYFTGFMVDCIDFTILMIESLEVLAIPKIMVHRYQMLTEQGRLIYNSNLIFTERVYDEFVKFGGMFVSALGLPLDATLNHSRIQEYVPAPALKCLQTLKSITRAKSFRRSVLPTPLELLSMDAEFGVPLHKVETFLK